MGERGDIIRLMQREITTRRLDRAGIEQVVATELRQPVVGRLIHRGLSDEHRDRHYVMIDGVDGRVHYVDIGRSDGSPLVAEGATIRLEPRSAGITAADRTIDAVARANGGRYSIDLHLRHDPSASESYAERHVRRLEAMRRAGAGLEREPDGLWVLSPDHLAQVEAYAQRQQRDRPVTLSLLSTRTVGDLSSIDAATWVDRALASRETSDVRDLGFGREVRSAMTTRRQWLLDQGLAVRQAEQIRLQADALERLRIRELNVVGGRLSDQLGRRFTMPGEGDRIEGVISRRVDLESGPYALIERAKDFTLVPWRDVLERNIGKTGSGIVRADGVIWQFGRGRGGPVRM